MGYWANELFRYFLITLVIGWYVFCVLALLLMGLPAWPNPRRAYQEHLRKSIREMMSSVREQVGSI